MKFYVLLLTAASLLSVVQSDNGRASTSPLNKVVQMLQTQMREGKAAKQEERVEFAKFSAYCDGTRTETKEAIKTGADNILQLKADVGKALSDAEVLAEEIEEQEAEVGHQESELKSATELREKERSDYEDTHKDFTESIVAIGKATRVIQSKSKDVPQSLLQVQRSALIPIEAKAAITSFIALSNSVEDEAPPKANAYEAQSGGIVAILEKLQLKFEDQRTQLEKEESSTKANFELLAQKLTDGIKDGKETIADKRQAKAERQETAANAKGELEVTEKAKEADEKKLSGLNVECDAKSKEYDQNQVTRADEIKAMETAVAILDSDAVAGTAEKHDMGAASLVDSGTALAQLRRSEAKEDDKRKQLVTYLQHRANTLGSKYLSLVAARALTDPFLKVKKMVKDLIVKLMEEANSEADQKGYCDSELATNKITREGKTNDVDELTANIEKLESDLSQVSKEINDLSKELSELRSEMKKATELRDEEKTINGVTIREAKDGQLAVDRATQVLKDYYAKASGASFIQDAAGEDSQDSVGDEMQQVASAPYRGMQEGKDGIIGMLEVILSDFARLESSTSSAEDEAAGKYTDFMNESTEDAEVKGVEMAHLEKGQQTKSETVRSLKKELKATQEELDAALEYYDKLKPDCVDTGLSYSDRVEMRQAEIQSLQEALKVLSDN